MFHPFKEMYRYVQGNKTCHQFSKDYCQYLSSTIWHRADLHTWNRIDLSWLFSCISLKDERKTCWVYATLDWGFGAALLDPLAEGPASSPMGASFDRDLFAFGSSLLAAVAGVRDVDGCAAPSFSTWFRDPLLSGLSANISSRESSSSSSIGGAGPLRRGLSFSPTCSNASISRLGIVSFSASLAVQVSSSFCLSLTSSPSCRPAAGVVGMVGFDSKFICWISTSPVSPTGQMPQDGCCPNSDQNSWKFGHFVIFSNSSQSIASIGSLGVAAVSSAALPVPCFRLFFSSFIIGFMCLWIRSFPFLRKLSTLFLMDLTVNSFGSTDSPLSVNHCTILSNIHLCCLVLVTILPAVRRSLSAHSSRNFLSFSFVHFMAAEMVKNETEWKRFNGCKNLEMPRRDRTSSFHRSICCTEQL